MILVVLAVILIVVAWIQHRRGKLRLQRWAVLIVVSFASLTFSALYATQQQRTPTTADYRPAWIGLGIAVVTLISGIALVYQATRKDDASRSVDDR